MSDPEILCLRHEHRLQWEPLWREYLRFYEVSLADQVTDQAWSRLTHGRRMHALGAFRDSGQLVGFVHYLFHPSTWSLADSCYLEDLFVAAEARRCGVGRRLIQAVYEAADAEGAPRVYWITSETNYAGRALYDKVATKSHFVQYRRR